MKSVIPQLQENADSLRQRLSDIRKVESRIEKRLREREREHKKYRSEEKELADLIEKRRALYRQTEGARQKQEAALKKLALEAKSIEDLILKIDSHAAAGRKPPPPRTAFAPAKPPSKSRPAAKRTTAAGPLPRNMTAPVAGTVRIAYGQTDDLGAKSLGISYDVRAGAAVVAPLGGTVRFAGPFQKFKQILIVEHKDGYHSLIAGLGRIDTVVGAALAAGEPVGTAERSAGTQTIYYELRRNGTPVNPANAMAARKG